MKRRSKVERLCDEGNALVRQAVMAERAEKRRRQRASLKISRIWHKVRKKHDQILKAKAERAANEKGS